MTPPPGQTAFPIEIQEASARLRGRNPGDAGKIDRHRYVLGGTPAIKGTRIPTSVLWEFHEAGHDVEAILREYATLSREEVLAALSFEADRRRQQKAVSEELEPSPLNQLVTRARTGFPPISTTQLGQHRRGLRGLVGYRVRRTVFLWTALVWLILDLHQQTSDEDQAASIGLPLLAASGAGEHLRPLIHRSARSTSPPRYAGTF